MTDCQNLSKILQISRSDLADQGQAWMVWNKIDYVELLKKLQLHFMLLQSLLKVSKNVKDMVISHHVPQLYSLQAKRSQIGMFWKGRLLFFSARILPYSLQPIKFYLPSVFMKQHFIVKVIWCGMGLAKPHFRRTIGSAAVILWKCVLGSSLIHTAWAAGGSF